MPAALDDCDDCKLLSLSHESDIGGTPRACHHSRQKARPAALAPMPDFSSFRFNMAMRQMVASHDEVELSSSAIADGDV